jgi:CelD/BcsL family acetyltransferase involved in cellulose biosynthesis
MREGFFGDAKRPPATFTPMFEAPSREARRAVTPLAARCADYNGALCQAANDNLRFAQSRRSATQTGRRRNSLRNTVWPTPRSRSASIPILLPSSFECRTTTEY